MTLVDIGDLNEGPADVGPANGKLVVAGSPSILQILCQGKANELDGGFGHPLGKKGGRRISKKR